MGILKTHKAIVKWIKTNTKHKTALLRATLGKKGGIVLHNEVKAVINAVKIRAKPFLDKEKEELERQKRRDEQYRKNREERKFAEEQARQRRLHPTTRRSHHYEATGC